MHPADLIDQTIEQTGSIACVGLDPRPALLPPAVRASHARSRGTRARIVADAFVDFNIGILDAIAGRCAAVKPQAACYEAYGAAGWEALEATVAHARSLGIPVVLDAKRGDIGSTATHYGQMAFGGAPGLDDEPIPGIGAEWLTANPYLGFDAIEPMLVDGHHGIFVLVKTSNPSGGDVQDVTVDHTSDTPDTVADRVADLVHGWGAERCGERGLSAIGAVVGATYPDHARALRARMPDTLFLVPGYGAQGGGAADALAGVRPDGRGALVSSSRGIIGAWSDRDPDTPWQHAISDALDAMNADLTQGLDALVG